MCGHTHRPFARRAHGRTVVNPGSLGLPYGRAGAHWATLHGGWVTLSKSPIETDNLIRLLLGSREVAAVSTTPSDAASLV